MCILLLAAGTAFPQFTGLSTTRDGSTLYVSSPLRLRGSEQSFNGKVFRLSGGAPALFVEQLPGVQIGWYNEKFYDLTLPDVSSDGSLVAYTGVRGCGGGSGCLTVQRAQGTVADPAGKTVLRSYGYVNLSPNGEYAVFFGRTTFAGAAPPAELASLRSGERTVVPYPITAQARRRVTNDGVVAVFKDGAIRLWSAAGETSIATSIAAAGYVDPLLMIGADGRRLVYETRSGLARYDRAAAAEETIAAAVPASVAIDENATLVAYVDGRDRQIRLFGREGPAFTAPEGFATVVLSGDGRVLFAGTRLGRLLRIAVATGAQEELVPHTPWVKSGYASVVPGSLVALTGVALAATTEVASAPLPRELGGVRVRIGGIDAPVRSVSPESVWIQVPWEVSAPETVRLEFLSGDSPFETPPGTVYAPPISPFMYGSGFVLTAVHQDWSGVVTPERPAASGEVVVLYFGGLGPVAPFIPTGEAAPAAVPARVISDFTCEFWDGSRHQAKVWFAGLAPGMVGVYQANVEVPAGLGSSSVVVTCGLGLPGSLATSGSLYVAQ